MDVKAVKLVRQVIAHARAAPADEERWRFLVSSVGSLFDARGTVLFTPEPGPGVVPLGISEGDVTGGMEDYFRHWAHQDAWLNAVDSTTFFQRAGETKFTQEFLPESQLTRTAFYNDWARHCNAERSLTLKITDASDLAAPPLHLSIFRKLADDPFQQEDKRLLESLWPELQAAAQAHFALQPLRAGSAVEKTLEDVPAAAWVLRDDARIHFANASAKELGRQQLWARERDGRLVRLGHLDAQAVVQAIAVTALPGSTARRAEVTAVPIETGLRRGLLHWAAVRESATYAAAWPGAAALVMLQLPLPATTEGGWHDQLARHFRLTPAQSAVLVALTRGQTVEDIAAARHVSVGTVRSHLHELMEKTGMRRQADLIRLALGQ